MSTAISVIVVAYRAREPLVACLESVERAAALIEQPPASTGEQVELIVVDNGGLAELVRAHSPRARILEPGENLGFAGGVQLGIETAQGEWVALVNDDATLERDALAQMLRTGRADPRRGAVAPQIRFRRTPGRINSAGIEVDSLGIAGERLAGLPVSAAAAEAEVFGATACVALYRAQMLREIGGFDRRFFAYLEDVDVAWRARAAGWTAAYEPRAVALHLGSTSSGEGSHRKYYLVGRNRVRLLARNATGRQLVRALPGILLYDSAYVAYAALRDRTLAPLRGRIAGLAGWRRLRREGAATRREVALGSAWRGWRGALRQHRAYRLSGS